MLVHVLLGHFADNTKRGTDGAQEKKASSAPKKTRILSVKLVGNLVQNDFIRH